MADSARRPGADNARACPEIVVTTVGDIVEGSRGQARRFPKPRACLTRWLDSPNPELEAHCRDVSQAESDVSGS